MQHISTTPFGRRPVTAGLLAAHHLADGPADLPEIDKWEVFGALRDARRTFGLTDRDLAVLNALLTFHRPRCLVDGDDMIVFPSNATLSTRAHGMAESTLRRHLAALVRAGVIRRHDSPNGKRYAVRNGHGGLARAFGFDLRPLLVRAPEIAACAEDARAETARLKAAREAITLLKRDAVKLALFAQSEGRSGDWNALLERSMTIHKALRRRLEIHALDLLHAAAVSLLDDTKALFELTAVNEPHSLDVEAEEMNGTDGQNERLIQNSITDISIDKKSPDGPNADPDNHYALDGQKRNKCSEISIPLSVVLMACPEIELYRQGKIAKWAEFTEAAARVGPMMGISEIAWEDASRAMGRDGAATVVACILQRAGVIRSPGGYLRSLTKKARAGGFSPRPMVMALLA